jgi:ankyrin repeat protein
MSYFGLTSKRDTDALRIVRNGNLRELKLMLLSNEELNRIRDDNNDNNDNLLHLATYVESPDMVEYLLDKGLNYNSLNKFGKSPWNLAVMIRNDDVINKYVTYMGISKCNHVKEIISLQSNLTKEKEVNAENERRLILLGNSGHEVNKLKRLNTELSSENIELRSSNKRLRDDNDELQQSNKKLKMSVETLMQNSKKK